MKTIRMKTIKILMISMVFLSTTISVAQKTWTNNRYTFNSDQGLNTFDLDINDNTPNAVEFSVGSSIDYLSFEAPNYVFKGDINGALDFSTTKRQMINLWDNLYGIGIQSNTQYFRTFNHFAWYKGGVHDDSAFHPGKGGTALMVLKSGSLGVGTTNPSEKLDVKGNIRTDWLKVGDLKGYWGGIHSYEEKLYIGSETGQEIAFVTQASGAKVKMTLTPNGDLGIGTTNPSEKLEVNGNVKVNKAIFFGTSQINADQGGAIELGGDGKTPYIDFKNDNALDYSSRIVLNGEGNLQVTGGIVETTGLNLTGDGANTNTIDSNINGTIVFGGEDGSTLTDTQIAESFYPNFAVWVEEGIVTEDIAVAPHSEWDGSQPDYVFETDYELPTLEAVEFYVKSNKHLEGIPSKAEVAEKGWSLPGMDQKLLKKIEELTLYTIHQEKEIKALKAMVDELAGTIKN